MKSIRKILFWVFLLIFSFILVTSIYENVTTTLKVNNLKEGMVLSEESTDTTKYYYKTSDAYYTEGDYKYPGSFCDILVTTDSSVEIPGIYEFLSYTVGGHAALCGMQYQDQYFSITSKETVDTTLNDTRDSAAVSDAKKWDDVADYPNYYILRVDLTEVESYEVFNEVVSCLGEPYNYKFLLDTTNTSYCSDLVSKAFRVAKINLNYDYGATTCLDLIASSKTELVGYKVYTNSITYYYIDE